MIIKSQIFFDYLDSYIEFIYKHTILDQINIIQELISNVETIDKQSYFKKHEANDIDFNICEKLQNKLYPVICLNCLSLVCKVDRSLPNLCAKASDIEKHQINQFRIFDLMDTSFSELKDSDLKKQISKKKLKKTILMKSEIESIYQESPLRKIDNKNKFKLAESDNSEKDSTFQHPLIYSGKLQFRKNSNNFINVKRKYYICSNFFKNHVLLDLIKLINYRRFYSLRNVNKIIKVKNNSNIVFNKICDKYYNLYSGYKINTSKQSFKFSRISLRKGYRIKTQPLYNRTLKSFRYKKNLGNNSNQSQTRIKNNYDSLDILSHNIFPIKFADSPKFKSLKSKEIATNLRSQSKQDTDKSLNTFLQTSKNQHSDIKNNKQSTECNIFNENNIPDNNIYSLESGKDSFYKVKNRFEQGIKASEKKKNVFQEFNNIDNMEDVNSKKDTNNLNKSNISSESVEDISMKNDNTSDNLKNICIDRENTSDKLKHNSKYSMNDTQSKSNNSLIRTRNFNKYTRDRISKQATLVSDKNVHYNVQNPIANKKKLDPHQYTDYNKKNITKDINLKRNRQFDVDRVNRNKIKSTNLQYNKLHKTEPNKNIIPISSTVASPKYDKKQGSIKTVSNFKDYRSIRDIMPNKNSSLGESYKLKHPKKNNSSSINGTRIKNSNSEYERIKGSTSSKKQLSRSNTKLTKDIVQNNKNINQCISLSKSTDNFDQYLSDDNIFRGYSEAEIYKYNHGKKNYNRGSKNDILNNSKSSLQMSRVQRPYNEPNTPFKSFLFRKRNNIFYKSPSKVITSINLYNSGTTLDTKKINAVSPDLLKLLLVSNICNNILIQPRVNYIASQINICFRGFNRDTRIRPTEETFINIFEINSAINTLIQKNTIF